MSEDMQRYDQRTRVPETSRNKPVSNLNSLERRNNSLDPA